jgi:hypothetical protein
MGKLGMVVPACNPSTQEDLKFQASFGYTVRKVGKEEGGREEGKKTEEAKILWGFKHKLH